MTDPLIILPLLASKFPGHIWRANTGYRIGFVSLDGHKHTKRFETYELAFKYLRWLSECEENIRVKYIIYRDEYTKSYSVSLANNETMLFDEIDLSLVQAHIWFAHNKGYVNCTKKDELPSTLFHVCAIGAIDENSEIIHLNKRKNDNRRVNIPVMKRTRAYCGKRKRG